MAPSTLAFLVLLIPLASAAVIALFLRRGGALASGISVAAAAGVLAVSSLLIFGGHRGFPVSVEWLRIGSFAVSFGIKFDDLAALMLFVVSFVGFFIHVFSLGYMRDDPAKARFFGGLSVFMFSMCGIVLADNLFMLFIFWELVGFSSYLLIGHWYERQSASDAAKKAFIVNRVGDFGFLLGIVMCYWLNGTVNLTELAYHAGAGSLVSSRAIPLLLFCGAVGKSAQMPLQVWLPDAMEGPTPVSALIHAATMVAAGIYMLCRIQVLHGRPGRCTVITWVGTITALFAATIAIVQTDIKKVLAYSTLSQLGYMFLALGIGRLLGRHVPPDHPRLLQGPALPGRRLGHPRHARRAGHAAHGRAAKADAHHRRVLHGAGWPSPASIPFTGFWSKDEILTYALHKSVALYAVGLFTALLTAWYMSRESLHGLLR